MTDLERVARAILKRRGEPDWSTVEAGHWIIDHDKEQARAALTTLREPSPAMVEAGMAAASPPVNRYVLIDAEDFACMFSAAIDAALKEGGGQP